MSTKYVFDFPQLHALFIDFFDALPDEIDHEPGDARGEAIKAAIEQLSLDTYEKEIVLPHELEATCMFCGHPLYGGDFGIICQPCYAQHRNRRLEDLLVGKHDYKNQRVLKHVITVVQRSAVKVK